MAPDRTLLGLLVGVALTSCAHHAVVDDGTSISFGWPREGMLINPVELPPRGAGYYTPPRWQHRGLRYGTEELVSMVVWAGRELQRSYPKTAFAVADLSLASGGPSHWHRSHQHGRDVDIIFITRDPAGDSLRPAEMRRFAADGSVAGEAAPGVRFDVERNWALVKLLLDNPVAEIQYIFVSDDLKQRLIEHAEAVGEPEDLIARAGQLLHQPSDSAVHDDHFHVRIYCPVADIAFGCRDSGAIRWVKKVYKYERRVSRGGSVRLLSFLYRSPGMLMLAIGAIPARGFALR